MNLKLRLLPLGVFMCLFAGWALDVVAQKQAAVPTREQIAKEIDQLESFTEMREHFRKRMKAYSTRYRAATNSEERQAVVKTIPKSTAYNGVLSRFVKEGSNEQAKEIVSWWWHGDRGKRDGELMVDILLEHHVDTEMLVNFVPRFSGVLPEHKAETAFRTLIKENSFDSVKASSMYSLQLLLAKKVKTLDGKEAEAMELEIQSLRDALKNEFAEATDLSGITFVERIDGAEYARNLKIGSSVPDIVGTDLESVEFRLSDYKDKVIVLDFWGHW